MAGFTAIATGIGLATTAGTTIGSFAQAGEQAKLKKEAEAAAAKSIMEARKKLGVNYYEQLGIQKEPYELARRELLAQGALATQALMEGDERSLAAGAGRVQLAQQAGQEKVATAMQQELSQLEKLVAGEETRLRDIGVQLDTMEAQGAQQAAADAQRAEAMAIQQGFAGLTSLGSQLVEVAPLYEKTPEVRAMNRIRRQAGRKGIKLEDLDLSDAKALKEAGINLTKRQFNTLQSRGIKTFDELENYNKTGSEGSDGNNNDDSDDEDDEEKEGNELSKQISNLIGLISTPVDESKITAAERKRQYEQLQLDAGSMYPPETDKQGLTEYELNQMMPTEEQLKKMITKGVRDGVITPELLRSLGLIGY